MVEERGASFGSYVDADLKAYLKETSEQVALAEAGEDREMLVANVLEELAGKEMKVATDADCSRMFELIVAACSDDALLGVLQRLASRETLFTVASKCAIPAPPAAAVSPPDRRPAQPVRLARAGEAAGAAAWRGDGALAGDGEERLARG